MGDVTKDGMNDQQTAHYQMFLRVIAFSKANPSEFTKCKLAAHNIAKLVRIVEQLAKTIPSHDSVVRYSLLRGDLEMIIQVARAIDQDQPGFAATFRPPVTPRSNDLLLAVDAVLDQLILERTDDAATRAAKTARMTRFLAYGLPATFAEDLAMDRSEIRRIQEMQEMGRENDQLSSAEIRKLIADGMKEIYWFNSMIYNQYGTGAKRFRDWMTITHIERPPQRQKRVSPAPVHILPCDMKGRRPLFSW
jgi:hypothetical protein